MGYDDHSLYLITDEMMCDDKLRQADTQVYTMCDDQLQTIGKSLLNCALVSDDILIVIHIINILHSKYYLLYIFGWWVYVWGYLAWGGICPRTAPDSWLN